MDYFQLGLHYIKFLGSYPYDYMSVTFVCTLALTIWCLKTRSMNCWFCNQNSKVKFGDRNSWVCPRCEQYNGFDPNGDYNTKIPGMHLDSNKTYKSFATPASAKYNDSLNINSQTIELCKVCSRNQLLKSKQVSKFQPMIEMNFEDEFRDFKDKLEDLYALCKSCDNAVKKHIKAQDTIIRGSLGHPICNNVQRSYASNSHEDNKSCHQQLLAVTGFLLKFSSAFHFLLVFAKPTLLMVSAFAFKSYADKLFDWINFELLKLFADNFLIAGSFLSTLIIFCKPKSLYGYLNAVLWWAFTSFLYPGTMSYAVLVFHQWLENLWLTDIFNVLWTLLKAVKGLIGVDKLTADTKTHLVQLASEILLFWSSSKACNVINTIEVGQEKKSSHRANFIEQKIDVPKTECYSDASSDDENLDGCGIPTAPCLNGSLNALNINADSPKISGNLFKEPVSQNNENAVASLYYTPPPSRSSSLLSLEPSHSLHQSLLTKRKKQTSMMNHNSLYNSTIKRKRPSSIYEKQSSIMIKSLKKNTHTKHKPLISPARLSLNNRSNLFGASLSDKPILEREYDSNFVTTDTPKRSWEHHLEGDITVNDSVSQIGLQESFLSSDEEQSSKTPIRKRSRVNLNSSSPKSIVSTLTETTVRGAAAVTSNVFFQVLCGVCVFINLALLIYVIKHVEDLKRANW